MLQAGMAFSATAAFTPMYCSTRAAASAGCSFTYWVEAAYSSRKVFTASGCSFRKAVRTMRPPVIRVLPTASHSLVISRATRSPSTLPLATVTKGWGSSATPLSTADSWATTSVASLFHSMVTSVAISRPFLESR